MTYLTISIVNHNSVLPLQACLESVLINVPGFDYEILVVDNMCEDRATSLLEEKFPQVRVLTNESTLGFSANHNQVLAMAKGEYCLVLNPDVTLEEGVLPSMLEFMDNHSQVALSSPKVTCEGGVEKEPPKHVGDVLRDTLLFSTYMLPGGTQALEKIRNIFSLVNRRSRFFHPHLKFGKLPHSDKAFSRSTFKSKFEQSIKWQETKAVYGACMLFRKAALQSVGLLDEGYFMYYEEIDWCVRARKAGWRIAYLPFVNVNHDGGYSTRLHPMKYLGISIISGLRFHHKHSGFLYSFLMKTFISLIAIGYLTSWSILSVMSFSKGAQFQEWMKMNNRILEKTWDPKTYQTVHNCPFWG
jgi:GT2 family glycosyltransferase